MPRPSEVVGRPVPPAAWKPVTDRPLSAGLVEVAVDRPWLGQRPTSAPPTR